MDRLVIAQFWDDCRAAGPLQVCAEVEAGAVDAPGPQGVPYPFAVIGRAPKADYRLEHGGVSRHHVYVQVIDGRVFWLDLGSRSGVSRDDVVVPSGWLEPGGVIGVGPFLVRAVVGAGGPPEGGTPPPSPIADRGPSSWPEAVLEFPDLTGGPGRWRLGRVLTLVGRAADCRLRIPDEAISRYHCALLRTPGGLWAVDLLSREGIRVDGARVRAARVGDGATLHIGRYRMVARRVDDAIPSSEAPAWDVARLAPDQLPAVAASPRPAEGPVVERPPGALSPADLEPFVARFEQMQLQMFEQFHQAMMTMFQSFGAMHRDQMDQVREELDRIRELTGELQSLQAGPAGPPTPTPVAPPATSGEQTDDRPPLPDRPIDPSKPASDPEIHDIISRRIARLQDERQGRWKRVLGLISGGPAT